MATGTVIWFDKTRGYGFISPDDGGKNVFVQHSAISGPLAEGFKVVAAGARVQFDARDGDHGPEAVKVTASRAAASR